MYIELEHDAEGNIASCYCVDTLPASSAEKLFTRKDGTPAGLEHVRINLDTLTAMEIDAKSGQKAVINAKGEPEIVQIDRTQYIRENFIVDMTSEVSIPANVIIPSGMKMRGLARKK
ncbi:MAG: hypothetical protein UX37_C0016G0012 [Microgenomates group bacterium GW2011_GWA2_46_16]|nr:MAG: hypothetical protein UX37_C0016G0012 [Microgenomates group bacterium GW2011_GWA2_46_16]